MSSSLTPIRAVLRCSQLLREGWHGKSELARRLGVSERTVKRYLAAIASEVDGYEVREVDERGLRHYRIRPPRLVDRRRGSPYEVMALAIAQRYFRAFDPGGVADLLDQTLFELTGEEEDAEEDAVDRTRRSLARRFVLAHAPQPLPGAVRRAFDQVLRGLVERRVLDLRYHSRRGATKDYVLRPYTLLLGARELAVTGAVGEPADSGRPAVEEPIRTFALHRIEGIGLRRTRFEIPPPTMWDPEARYADSWGLFVGEPERVGVSIHPRFEDLVAGRSWHPSQRVGVPANDGWIPLEFEVFSGGEFRTWVLGWGPWLRVDFPEDLRLWVERLRSIAPGEGEPAEDEVFRIP